jgi:hypothetical protein
MLVFNCLGYYTACAMHLLSNILAAVILDSLRVPNLDLRMQEIETRADHTFDWVYDKPSVALPKWLQRGQDIFWISGKPGSGKSTLMKFIQNDSRTSELLHRWKSSARQISASFFFHYRGSVMQKSFEGLLRGVISQILLAEPSLLAVLQSAFEEEYIDRVTSRTLGTLQSDIYELLSFCRIGGDGLNDEVAAIVRNQDARFSLRRIFGAAVWCYAGEEEAAEKELLRHKDALLEARRDQLDLLISNLCKDLSMSLRSDFRNLVMSWRESLDVYFQLRQLLQRRGFDLPTEAPEHQHSTRGKDQTRYAQSGGGFQNPLEERINNLLQRHKARTRIRVAVQTQWSKERLEKVLHLLCKQRLFDLDLVLMLDALDEYDGRPEFISGFLKDLAHDTSFPRTKARVLFSSRPWNVLREEFGSCLGFKIHEHTENDIRNYCITSICKSSCSPESLLPLVEEIVARSSGVFLWVKLVLRDLFDITAQVTADGGQLKQQLRRTLDALPDQLDQYYAAIIERVSPASRWDTYVVLECLARSSSPLTATVLVDIVSCSMARRWPEAGRIRYQKYSSEEAEHFIREISGGLVDFMPNHVQLMHQTVKDFITDPQFRQTVLGQDRGKITEENGHSFLAKYLFLKSLNANRFAFYAREAERTTGLSQYDLIARAPTSCFERRTCLRDGEANFYAGVSTPLTVAAFAGLRLFLEDAFRVDRHVLQNCRESLLRGLTFGMKHGLPPEEGLRMIESVITKGFDTDQDSFGWVEIMSILRNSASKDLSGGGNVHGYLAKHINNVDVLMMLAAVYGRSLPKKSTYK